MSKSVLVIDTPESCSKCHFCGKDNMTYRDYCLITSDVIPTLDKSDLCPLRELPRKRNTNAALPPLAVEVTQEEYDRIDKNPNIIYFIKNKVNYEYYDGWDDCIDYILGVHFYDHTK